MFKEFLKRKNLTQKEVAEIYMNAVMFALNKKLYAELKDKWLNMDDVKLYYEKRKIGEDDGVSKQ